MGMNETPRGERIHIGFFGNRNAGKSSLMNALLSFSKERLAEAVEEKDMLFATLDTTVRRIVLEKGEEFLLADTVGFIRSLPDKLLDAFHSTLEEAVEADLILQVIDYSDPNYRKHMDTTVETLKKLGASHIPTLYILNKCDKVLPLETLPKLRGEKLYISVKEGIGIKEVADAITKALSARLRGGVIAQFGASSGAFGGAISQAQFNGPGKHAGGVNRPALNLPGGNLAGGGEQVVLGVRARVVQRNTGVAEGFFVTAGFYDVGDIRLAQVAQGEAFGNEFGLVGLYIFAVF